MAAKQRAKQRAKPRARRRPAARAKAPDASLQSITLLVGQISGELKSHIEAVTHDRAEREDDRRQTRQYHSEVRETLSTLREGVGKIAGLTTRLDAVEKTAVEFKSYRNKVAGILLAVSFFWALLAEKVKKVFA